MPDRFHISPRASVSESHPETRRKQSISISVSETANAESPQESSVDPRKLTTAIPTAPSAMSAHSQKSVARTSPSKRVSFGFDGTTSDPRVDSILSDIASYVRFQDEVTTLRVETQQKRTQLSHHRDQVASKDDNIMRAIRKARNTGIPLDSQEYAKLFNASETARTRLGPAEQAYTDLDIRLVSKEASLMARGKEIQKKYQSLGNSDVDKVFSDPQNEPSTTEGQDDASSQFSFQSTSASAIDHSQAGIADNSPRELPVPMGLLRTKSFAEVISAENRSTLDFANSGTRYATHASSRKQETHRRFEEIVPDLMEEPELYVRNIFEHEGMNANGEEYMEPFLTSDRPISEPEPRSRLFTKGGIQVLDWIEDSCWSSCTKVGLA